MARQLVLSWLSPNGSKTVFSGFDILKRENQALGVVLKHDSDQITAAILSIMAVLGSLSVESGHAVHVRVLTDGQSRIVTNHKIIDNPPRQISILARMRNLHLACCHV